MKLNISGKDYEVKYGYNAFCDTDLLDRVQLMATFFSESGASNDADVKAMGKIKDMFLVVRELLFVGFMKKNPVESLESVGDLLDLYKEEAPEGEERGLLELFTALSEELVSEGFLSDILTKVQNVEMAPAEKRARRAK